MREDPPIRVLITDDHLIVRQGLQLVLETDPGIEVAGVAGDGAEALAQVEALRPDVVLMDLRMPGMDGITAIGHLQRDYPDVAVVILTTFNEDDLMFKGLQAGARGFLLKDTEREPLINTIYSAARGETLLQPEVLARVLSQVSADAGPAKRPATTDGPALTEREIEVLRAVAAGHTNKAIALQLGITERTVKAHLSHVYDKFGVDSRAAAIAVAAERGLI